MAFANRSISKLNISQSDLSQQAEMIEGNDFLSGSLPMKIIAYRAEAPFSSHPTSNFAVELQIGEREKIGQGTFGYERTF